MRLLTRLLTRHLCGLLAATIAIASALPAQDTLLVKGLTSRTKADMDSITYPSNPKSHLTSSQINANNRAKPRVRARQDSIVVAMRVATPAPPPPPPAGIAIFPGTSIQSVVNANPSNSVFLLKTGTHDRQNVIPKDSDTFRGEAGARMDGGGVTQFAFQGYTGTRWIVGVKLVNFAITLYAPPAQNGAVWGGNDETNSTTSWVLDSMDISYNKNLGVRIGNRMQIVRSKLHHNGTINIGGIGKAVLVDTTEVSYGNETCPNDPGFESGGSKFVRTDSLIVRRSFFHHNCGVGLWLDINNINYLLEKNRIEDNIREGIAIEISYGGRVHKNTVTRNGNTTDPWRTQNWLWDAGIGVHASANVEIDSNTVTDNFNGIVGIQQSRGAYVLSGMNVYDNTVKQNTPMGAGLANAAAGIVQDNGDATVFTGRNNHFTHNAYTLIPSTPGQSPGFEWQGWKTCTEWKAIPNDATGTCTFTP